MSKGEVFVRPATLKAFRRKERLSQAALAAKATEFLRLDDPEASVSESLVALIETDRRQPSLRNAEAIAAALGVDLEAIADVGAAEAVAP